MTDHKSLEDDLENMLDYFKIEFHSIVEKHARDIQDLRKKLLDLVNKEKEPFLREIMNTYKDGSRLENKYNASDMLTLLEKFQEKLI